MFQTCQNLTFSTVLSTMLLHVQMWKAILSCVNTVQLWNCFVRWRNSTRCCCTWSPFWGLYNMEMLWSTRWPTRLSYSSCGRTRWNSASEFCGSVYSLVLTSLPYIVWAAKLDWRALESYHIVDCELDGGLSGHHSADDDAVQWLTNLFH